jgi:hypothetical protein
MFNEFTFIAFFKSVEIIIPLILVSKDGIIFGINEKFFDKLGYKKKEIKTLNIEKKLYDIKVS